MGWETVERGEGGRFGKDTKLDKKTANRIAKSGRGRPGRAAKWLKEKKEFEEIQKKQMKFIRKAYPSPSKVDE